MQVHFYGILADLSGARTLSRVPERLDTGEALRQWLSETYPPMAEMLARPSTRLLLNNETEDWAAALATDDDIAIIPMVSGG